MINIETFPWQRLVRDGDVIVYGEIYNALTAIDVPLIFLAISLWVRIRLLKYNTGCRFILLIMA